MDNSSLKLIVVVAVAVLRGEELLMVRKRGGTLLILPGGKMEPGELEPRTARREVAEELGCRLTGLRRFGEFVDQAAHERRHVRIALYTAELLGEPTPQREIEEVRWVPLCARVGLAPVHRQINPALRASIPR